MEINLQSNLQRASDQLDALIDRRAAEREREALWAESVQAHAMRCREENRAEWVAYHKAQARRIRTTSEALVAYHKQRAAQLEGTRGEGGS